MKAKLTIPPELAESLGGCAEGDQITVTVGAPTYADDGSLSAEVTDAVKVESEEVEDEVEEVVVPKKKGPPALDMIDED